MRKLAADLRLDIVGEQRAAVLVGERDLGGAFGEAGNAALAFAGDAVAVGRVEVGEADLAFPARLHRADLDGRHRLEFVVRILRQQLAARDAALEHFRVVELRPYRLPAGGKLHVPAHRHRHRLFSVDHAFDAGTQRRGCPAPRPGMTKKTRKLL